MVVNLNLFPYFVSSALRTRAKQRDCRCGGKGLVESEVNIRLQNIWRGRFLVFIWDDID